jgi:hypothetical protein
MSEIGIGYFGSMVLLIAAAALFPDHPAVWNAIGIAFTASLLPAVLLIAAQISMRQLCTLCLAVHAVNATGALIYWTLLRDGWTADGLAGALLLMAVFVAIIVLLVVPYAMSATRLDALGDSVRRMMRSPFASLAQLQTESPTNVSGALCGVPLGDPAAEHELVIFAHEGCSRCEPVLAQVHGLVSQGLVRAFLAIAPKNGDDVELRSCAWVLAAALSLPPEARLQAYAAAKKHSDDLGSTDVARLLAGEIGIAPEKIEESFDGAWALIKRCQVLSDEHVEVTPAVFFDSRKFTGPLAHLEFLLTTHPDLVSRGRAQAGVAG